MNRLLRRTGARLHREEGQSLVETIVFVFPVCFLLLAGILFFGRAFYCMLALDAASFDGARMGIESLSRHQGVNQGYFTARQSLESWHLDPTTAQIEIGSTGAWDRGGQVACRVRYQLYVGDIPFLELFFTGGKVPLQSVSYDSVERFKSRWTP